jgi:hypothetical protein
MDQEKDTNPIAEIFDEVFTLMEDLETRSVAVLEYLKEQGGVTDEKLAPYLDRAAAASDVRWRAARARMEHLLAPKPKSATEVGKDERTKDASQSSARMKSGEGKPQDEKQPSKVESKDLGKELTSAPSGSQDSNESKDAKSQELKPSSDTKSNQKKSGDGKQGKEEKATSRDAKSQAAALGGEKKSDSPNGDSAKNQGSQSGSGKVTNHSSDEAKQQTEKAAK